MPGLIFSIVDIAYINLTIPGWFGSESQSCSVLSDMTIVI
jgi:hypothetical protein